METEVKARRFGGSVGIILPRAVVEKERIVEGDLLKVRVRKVADLSFLWGMGKDITKSTDRIMEKIDEGEVDD